jgi:hypothetical protein
MIAIPKKRNSYELLENNEVKGTLTYKNIFTYSANIQTSTNDSHAIKRIFSWFAKFKITQDDIEKIKLKMNWRGHFSIIMENGVEYKIISKGIFKIRTFLKNKENNELIEIKAKYNWKRWRYEYEFENSETPQAELLNLIAVYALNYNQQYQVAISVTVIMACNVLIKLTDL